jgi:hypothetical protein
MTLSHDVLNAAPKHRRENQFPQHRPSPLANVIGVDHVQVLSHPLGISEYHQWEEAGRLAALLLGLALHNDSACLDGVCSPIRLSGWGHR